MNLQTTFTDWPS